MTTTFRDTAFPHGRSFAGVSAQTIFLVFFVLLALLAAPLAAAQTSASFPPDSGSPRAPVAAPDSTAPADSSYSPPPPPRRGTVNMGATVVRASKAALVKRQAYNVNAVDMTRLREKNVAVRDVIGRTSGVVVRESGGLGAGSDISLNGMSGNQVRVFLDGLPLEGFGPSLSLGNIPAGSIETIEVYKGVVPIHLAADALGGAINVVTNSRHVSYLDASYAYSSFHTRKAHAEGQWVSDSARALVKASAFHNASDNDYPVTVSPVGDSGRYGEAVRVRRFHDAYRAHGVSLEAGVFDRKWADLATVRYGTGFEHDDIQHGASMDRVYGMVFNETRSRTFGAKFRKRDAFVEGLSLAAHAAFTRSDYKAVDTAARVYDWYGNYTPNMVPGKGESQWEKIFYVSEDDVFASSLNASYEFSPVHEVSANYALNRHASLNRDKLDAYGHVYDKPSVIRNHVGAASYRVRLFEENWSTTFFAKAYHTAPVYRTYDYETSVETVDRDTRTYPGYGLATTLFASRALQLKSSYEHAVRVPESFELFGDGVLQLANTALRPERSDNINLGVLYGERFGAWRFRAESNLFFRDVKGLIRQEAVGPTSQAVNLGSAQIAGVEGELGGDFAGVLEARVNAAYDHAINTTETVNGQPSDVYLDRIPNRPYLYGNASVTAHWHEPAGAPGRSSLSLDTRYVKSYTLRWPSQGTPDSKFIVPAQLVHSASLVYAAPRDRVSLALECANLFDEDVYDNFRQQKPGRTFSAKVRFAL